MIWDAAKFYLGCYEDFNKAANSGKHSERWREDMARRAGEYLGRYYAEKLKDTWDPEVAALPMKSDSIKVSTRAAIALLEDPKYAHKVKVRV